jgi:hypothetical protein
MSTERLFTILLHLYPGNYRALFAGGDDDSVPVGVRRASRPTALSVRFVIAEFGGPISGMAAEWIAKLTTDASTRDRSHPDLGKSGQPAFLPNCGSTQPVLAITQPLAARSRRSAGTCHISDERHAVRH